MPRLKPPAAADVRRLLLALALGAVGGAIFTYYRIPLGWMIGAMSATTLAAVIGARVLIPGNLRALMLAVLGIMLGSAFKPAIFERIDEWIVSLSGLFLYVMTAAGAAFFYFRKVGGFDTVTAYFSAAPGGLNQMIMVGAAMGGDDRAISLVHGTRILFVVLTIPFFFRVFEGYQGRGLAPTGVAAAGLSTVDLAILAACAVAGILLARTLRVPAPALLGPMILSAAAHLTGVTESQPPPAVIAIAQVVVGAAIGCRFVGVSLRQIVRMILLGAGGTAILIGVALIHAVLLGFVTDLSYSVLLLAYSPGGVAEMSLIGLALGADAAFVSTHHLVRILIVVALAPAVFKAGSWLRRSGRGAPAE